MYKFNDLCPDFACLSWERKNLPQHFSWKQVSQRNVIFSKYYSDKTKKVNFSFRYFSNETDDRLPCGCTSCLADSVHIGSATLNLFERAETGRQVVWQTGRKLVDKKTDEQVDRQTGSLADWYTRRKVDK